MANGSQMEIKSLITNVTEFHKLLYASPDLTKEGLQARVQATEELIAQKLNEALKKIVNKPRAPTDQELELLSLCLSGIVCKSPVLDLAALGEVEFAKAFKTVLQRDCPSFPLPQTSISAQKQDEL